MQSLTCTTLTDCFIIRWHCTFKNWLSIEKEIQLFSPLPNNLSFYLFSLDIFKKYNVTEDIKYVNLWIGGNMGSLSERKKFGKDDAGCRGGAKHQGGCHQRRVI